MIKIGEYQTLKINREMPQGLYVVDDTGEDEILMPRAYVTEDMKIGDMIEVFVYCDSEDRDIATTEKPLLAVGEFAMLNVNAVNDIGAFCDWGTSKELLVPYSNQAYRLKKYQSCIVHMYLDDMTDRLVGTTKLDGFLKKEADEKIKMGKQVEILVAAETDIGFKVIIDQEYLGLIYKNEIHGILEVGHTTQGYIKPLRDDGKIDVSLDPIGVASIGANEQLIMDMLDIKKGFLPFTDKSPPDLIRKNFGLSKKLFKKVIGSLYRQKLIRLEKDGIYRV